MKKILQINVFYDYRSTGRIVKDIHEELLKTNEFDSYVIYGRIKTTRNKNVIKNNTEFYSKFMNVLSRFTGIIYGQCFLGTKSLLRKINRIKPDLVHIHCPNGYFCNIPKLIKYLKKNNYPLLLTQHCEFFYTGNCGYAFDCDKWKLGNSGCGKCPQLKVATQSLLFDRTKTSFNRMKNAFDGYKELSIASCTPWLNERADESIILSNYKKMVVYNGTDINLFKNYNNILSLKKELNIPSDNKVVLFVCAVPQEPIKGFNYFLKLAELSLKDKKKYTFLFVGGDGKSHYLPNIINIGQINNSKELAKLYSGSDLSIILSKNECFPMTIAESVCCGTKVIGFKCHGPDHAYNPELAEFVEYGNINEVYFRINRFFNNIQSSRTEIEKKAHSMLSRTKMCQEYINIYNEILSKNESN